MNTSPYLARPIRTLAEVLGLRRLDELREGARLADVAAALLRQTAERVGGS